MPERKHRTQILLEPRQHQALVEIAEAEARSISDVVREMIDRQLAERRAASEREWAVAALGHLSRLRAKIEQRYGVYAGDPVAEARAERAAQQERLWQADAP